MRPAPPPRQTTRKPDPRPPPPSSKAHRYAKFAKSESEAKQVRAAAEQSEKAKEDAETKTGAFKGWEQMKSSVNSQNFHAPPKPKPPEYAGCAQRAANAVPPNEPPRHQRSWVEFPESQAGIPGMARTQSTRKKQSFAPATPGGDEPVARNTSVYFNVSRGDRPQAAVPQSYFNTSISGQAPTARKQDSPIEQRGWSYCRAHFSSATNNP